MAKTISLSEAKARFGAIVEEISVSGESVIVLDQNQPVVVLSPPEHVQGHPPADDSRWRSASRSLLDFFRVGKA